MSGEYAAAPGGSGPSATSTHGDLLGVIAAALRVVAVALPILVLALIGNLPGEDLARTQRSHFIAFGAFLSFALLAIPATIGFLVVRHAQVNNYDT